MDQDDVRKSGQDSSLTGSPGAADESLGMRDWHSILEQPAEAAGDKSLGPQSNPFVPHDTSAEGPPTKPVRVTEETPREWSTALLRVLTYGVVVVGLPIVATAAYANYTSGRLGMLSLWVLLYLSLLLPLLFGSAPYALRAVVFLGFIYAVGLLSFFQPGFRGLGTPTLVCLSALVTLLLGRRAGFYVLAGLVSTAGIAAAVTSSGSLSVPTSQVGRLPFPMWWGAPLAILLLGGALVLSGSELRQRLSASRNRESKLGAELADAQRLWELRGEQLNRLSSQWQAAADLAQVAVSAADAPEIIDNLLQLVSDRISCSVARLYVLDESASQLCLHSTTGAAEPVYQTQAQSIRLGSSGIVGWVGERQVPYVALDTQADEMFGTTMDVPGTRSEAAFPLVVDSSLVGVLDIHAREPEAFSPRDIEFLSLMASWASLVLDHRRLAAVPSAVVDVLSIAAGRLSAAATKTDVVDAIVETVAQTRAGTCLVSEFLRTPDGTIDSLICLRAWRRHGKARPAPGTRLPLTSALFPIELLDGTWIVPDVAADERLSVSAREVFASMRVRALVGFPLQGDRERVGHVLVLYGSSSPFSASTLQLFKVLEHQAGLALKRATRLDEAYAQAQHAELMAQAARRMHESLDLHGILSAAAVDIGRTLKLAALDVRLGSPPDDDEGSETASSTDQSRLEMQVGQAEED